jgi:hypothetical protein
MTPTVILIGPICAGKSTIATLLAEKLNLPHYSVDDERWAYYEEAGYDKAAVKQIADSEGMVGVLRYWKPFEVHAVERVLADHSGSVIDFGAGHSVHEDPDLFARVERALAPFPNVILLLPSADLDESVAILNDRFENLLMREVGKVDPGLLAVNEQFVKYPSNHKLAKIVIYTNGNTPEESCDELLQKIVK